MMGGMPLVYCTSPGCLFCSVSRCPTAEIQDADDSAAFVIKPEVLVLLRSSWAMYTHLVLLAAILFWHLHEPAFTKQVVEVKLGNAIVEDAAHHGSFVFARRSPSTLIALATNLDLRLPLTH